MTYTTSRRRFLCQLGGAAAGLSAPFVFDVFNKGLPFAWGAGETDTLPVGSPILVHIALDGGNDYLNTLVPVGDPWYHDNSWGHGGLSLTEADTLGLTGTTYRLHKNLPWLANRWNTNGDVAFALGVGNRSDNFSHFESMKYWAAGKTDVRVDTGWMGRYADLVRPGNPLASVSIGDLRYEAYGKTAPTLVLSDTSAFTYVPAWLNSDIFTNSQKQFATIPGTNMVSDVSRMIGTTFGIADRVRGASDPAITGGSQNYKPITQQLLQVAVLIRSGIPSQTYTLGWHTFDTHMNQKVIQAARFTELNEALTQFFQALAGHPRERDVFLVISSEFGRKITWNKDGGTDHGQAGMAIFIAGGAQRGVYGEAPTLDPGGPTKPNRTHDAAIPTVDFRSVHATALNRLNHGDANMAQEILRGTYEDLGVFPAAIYATTTTAPPTTTTTVKPTTTTAANRPPVASFTASKTAGVAPLSVSFNAGGSKDPDGVIPATGYAWQWGDGTPNTSGKLVSHKFTKRGTFTVRLTVTDSQGATGTATKSITVL